MGSDGEDGWDDSAVQIDRRGVPGALQKKLENGKP